MSRENMRIVVVTEGQAEMEWDDSLVTPRKAW